MSVNNIPKFMETGIAMIACAFPDGLDDASYYALLSVLYTEMSDRNLADMVAASTTRPYGEVLNDAYSVASGETVVQHQDIARVKSLLEGCGLRQWLEEDE